MPGDSLFIPDIQPKSEYGDTQLRHQFRLKGVPVRLRFRLQDYYGQPRTAIPYSIEVDGKKSSGVTDGDGMVEVIVEPDSQKAKLTVTPVGSPIETYEFNLGYMNPAQDVTGIQGRLKNLGFYKGEVTGQLDDPTKRAISKFQNWAGIPETGAIDPGLVSAVDAAHGG